MANCIIWRAQLQILGPQFRLETQTLVGMNFIETFDCACQQEGNIEGLNDQSMIKYFLTGAENEKEAVQCFYPWAPDRVFHFHLNIPRTARCEGLHRDQAMAL